MKPGVGVPFEWSGRWRTSGGRRLGSVDCGPLEILGLVKLVGRGVRLF